MTAPFIISTLSPTHDRSGFSCGIAALDRYLQQQVMQDVRRRVTACFVAREASNGKLAGYYTLAAADVPLLEMPEAFARGLPNRAAIPVTRLSRLVVAQAYQGRRLGSALLWDAVERSLRFDPAVFALIADAKDGQAETFYLLHGFVPFNRQPRQLVLPLAKRDANP